MALFDPFDPKKLSDKDIQPIDTTEVEIKKTTSRTVFLFILIFFAWANYAPIDDGVSVSGTVVVEGNRKAVQHPNGGVIAEILVKEGDSVEQGQVLVKINPLRNEASLISGELNYLSALALESRLLSEQREDSKIVWLTELDGYADQAERVAEMKAQQEALFKSRKAELSTQLSIMNQQMIALRTSIGNARQLLDIKQNQLNTNREQLASNRVLADEGIVPRSKIVQMELEVENLIGSIGSLRTEISNTNSKLSEVRLSAQNQKTSFRKSIESELSSIQKERKSLKASVDSLKFELALTDVRAPVSGTVVGMTINTVGGVVSGGELLMQVLPSQGNLVVKAEVPPQNIDKVSRGMDAVIRFSAFNVATTPTVMGQVTLVGADLFTPDPLTSKGFYLAEIEAPAAEFKQLSGLEIQPGMPVDITVKAGEKTFMQFVLKPLEDRFAKVFQE